MHKEKFFEFIKDLNENNVDYYFLRGFGTLPDRPDTDIDLVYNYEQYDLYHKIAKKHLSLKLGNNNHHDFGFAEYTKMIYTAYFTEGPADKSIVSGRFRVDSYSCLYFFSPFSNFKKYWVLPHDFNKYVSDTKGKVEYEVPYYIPSPECELILLVIRDVLDLKGKWKQKHINRINHLKTISERDKVLECCGMVLPHADEIVERIYKNEYNKIFQIATKGRR